MKSKINEFEKLQKKALGFERYKIRGQGPDEFAVDVYTQMGLLIKTKMAFCSREKTIKFIEEYSQILNDLILKENEHDKI